MLKRISKFFTRPGISVIALLILCLLLTWSPIFNGVVYADTSKNVADGKTITSSDVISGNVAYVTDGVKNSDNYIGVTSSIIKIAYI